MEVTIEKLVYGGEGLARTQEGILLVPDALPGERVEVEPEPPRRGVRRARLLRILEPGPDRIAPPCPYFSQCGGCQHQQANYEQQLEWKRAILAECLERIGKLRLDIPIATQHADPWGYRNRIRLHVENGGGIFRVGFQRAGSNDLTAIENCAISSPLLQHQIQVLSTGVLPSVFRSGQAEIELFDPNSGRESLATITSDLPAPNGFGEVWKVAFPECESVCWLQRRRAHDGGQSALQRKVWGSGAVTVRVGDYQYRVGHESFFQTNRFLLEKMLAAACKDTAGERALDLFAGVGFFALPLAGRFKNVVAVEPHHASSKDLEANATSAQSRVHVYAKTAEQFLALRAGQQPWDLVAVDPPRYGLSKPVREAILHLQPARIVYVSCDPTTLARDLAFFLASYRLESIDLIDLFPQTYHLETIVHLVRLG